MFIEKGFTYRPGDDLWKMADLDARSLKWIRAANNGTRIRSFIIMIMLRRKNIPEKYPTMGFSHEIFQDRKQA